MRWHVALAVLVTGVVALAVTRMRDGTRAGPVPAPPPGPSCELPPRGCAASEAMCARFVEMPTIGEGYLDIRLDSERTPETSTSYLRGDLALVIRYAAAKVACKAADWPTGNGGPVALGDMSERDGSTPGTAAGKRRHPLRTHRNGLDIDIAYFQRDTLDNQLRPICAHRTAEGVDQHRCLAAPEQLDAWRTALFLGAILEEPRIRIIGIDGRAARPILAAFDALCASGWIAPWACSARSRIHYELHDDGGGWYRGHHNHLHVSWRP